MSTCELDHIYDAPDLAGCGKRASPNRFRFSLVTEVGKLIVSPAICSGTRPDGNRLGNSDRPIEHSRAIAISPAELRVLSGIAPGRNFWLAEEGLGPSDTSGEPEHGTLECDWRVTERRSARPGLPLFPLRECGRQFNERSARHDEPTQHPSDTIALVVLWRLASG